MRDRIIVAVCVLGVLSVIGGIVLFANSGDDAGDSQARQKEKERIQAGEGIFVGGPFFNLFFDEPRQDASQPVNTTNGSSQVVRSTGGVSRAGAAPPVARPAVPAVRPVPVCTPSLLGSVVGLLGSLVGGGGGC